MKNFNQKVQKNSKGTTPPTGRKGPRIGGPAQGGVQGKGKGLEEEGFNGTVLGKVWDSRGIQGGMGPALEGGSNFIGRAIWK